MKAAISFQPDSAKRVNIDHLKPLSRPSTLLAEAQHSPMCPPFSLPSASRVFGTAVTKGKGREEDVTGDAHVFCDDGKQSSAWVGPRNPHAWMTPRLPHADLGYEEERSGAGTRITPPLRTTREADRAPRRRKKSRADAGREINHDNMRSRPFPVISPPRTSTRTRRRAYTSIRLPLPPAPRRRAEERAASDGESVAR
ncbi:hypothetical protein B0H13DRAFT_2012514, partial [Mycena leptocephala]